MLCSFVGIIALPLCAGCVVFTPFADASPGSSHSQAGRILQDKGCYEGAVEVTQLLISTRRERLPTRRCRRRKR